MSKTTTNKKVVILQPCDFPFEPDTGEYFTGIKSMELTGIGYEFHKYLEKRIDEGGLTLKDVASEFFDYLCASSWEEFCKTYSDPNNNIDAFTDWLADYYDDWDSIFVTETDKELIFCPIGENYEDKSCDLEDIVSGICSLFSTRALNESKTKTVCIGKVEVNDIHTVSAEKASVTPISTPLFTKL